MMGLVQINLAISMSPKLVYADQCCTVDCPASNTKRYSASPVAAPAGSLRLSPPRTHDGVEVNWLTRAFIVKHDSSYILHVKEKNMELDSATQFCILCRLVKNESNVCSCGG